MWMSCDIALTVTFGGKILLKEAK